MESKGLTAQQFDTHSKDIASQEGENRLRIVYNKALQNKPLLDAFILRIARKTGAKPISNLKNPITTVEKTVEKRVDDPKRNYQPEDVNDIARARLIYGSLDSLHKGIEEFKKDIKATKMQVTKEDNYFQHPEDSYVGYHIDIKFPNGQHSEVQFHTIQSYAASMATHAIHDKFGDNTPKDVEEQKSKLTKQVLSMDNKQALQLATAIEKKNALPQAAAQVDALKVAAGIKNVSNLLSPKVLATTRMFDSLRKEGKYGI